MFDTHLLVPEAVSKINWVRNKLCEGRDEIMRGYYESFSRFFETATREDLRDILKVNMGEQDNLDFKAEWPAYSKMAKHILAFANSGGGCIILGVSQQKDGTLETLGINTIKDKAEVVKSLNSYIPNDIQYDILDFSYNSSEYEKIVGKKFQVIFIEDDPEHLPFVSKINGDGIRQNAIYFRRGTSSEEATFEELQKIINRRIETGYSTSSEMKLEEHLAQLKILYSNIERYNYEEGILNVGKTIGKLFIGEAKENPDYPKENFEKFILRMITSKKAKIEGVLNLR